MPSFLKESLVYRLVSKICTVFCGAYAESAFKALFCDRIAVAWQNSKTHKIITSYFDKNPAFEGSLCFKIISGTAGLFDRFFSLIHRAIFAVLGGSVIWQKIQDARRLTPRGILFVLGILFMSAAIGGVVGYCVTGGTGTDIVLCWCVFGLGAVLVLCSVFYQKVTECGIAKLIKWLLK